MLPLAHPTPQRLVFVDTETTGLNPALDRIIEIGVVMVTDGIREEWTTLLNPRTPLAASSHLLLDQGEERARALPRFSEVAQSLLQRLGNRLLVAHNARFDYAFLKAEFERAGIQFQADVLCSLALSRKLYGHHHRHDLASLVERHALTPGDRHRALPDARAVCELWQRFHLDHSQDAVESAVRDLLAGPLLPDALDPALIDRLPEKPGTYVLHGKERALHVGRAANLRLQLTNFFRLDRLSTRSAGWIDSIVDITWQVASGDLGSRLQRVTASRSARPAPTPRGGTWSWSFDPQARPAVTLTTLPDGPCGDHFGMFQSERKARNALARLAAERALCRTLLGLPEEGMTCAACQAASRAGKQQNLSHLAQAYAALLPWKFPLWPFPGPIAIREGRVLHIADRWRYLGAARVMEEVHALLESKPAPFDAEICAVLARALARLSRRRIAQLQCASKGGTPVQIKSGEV